MYIHDSQVLAFFQGIGTTEIIIICFVVLLLFGSKRLPELAKGMGKAISEFKRASSNIEKDIKSGLETDDAAKPLPAEASKAPEQSSLSK